MHCTTNKCLGRYVCVRYSMRVFMLVCVLILACGYVCACMSVRLYIHICVYMCMYTIYIYDIHIYICTYVYVSYKNI